MVILSCLLLYYFICDIDCLVGVLLVYVYYIL
jgi:hypothetical protein